MTKLEQTDFFSMFDIVDEVAEKKKREAEERQRKAEELRKQAAAAKDNTSSSVQVPTKKEPEKDKFEVNENTIIRNYGESIEITAYFTTEELAEGLLVKKKGSEETERIPLDGEMLRKRMEKDFPELIKEFTEMVYIKAKNIVVVTQKAKKKGNCIEGAQSTDCASSLFKYPKIPFALLRDFIAVAKLFGEANLEVHADIYLDCDTKIYFLDFPNQRVNSVIAEVIESSSDIAHRIGDAIKVLEIHSHHSMAPLPSKQDDSSERIPGKFYAIVGRTQNFLPELTARTFISEEEGFLKVSISQLFEDPFFNLPEYNENMIEVC